MITILLFLIVIILIYNYYVHYGRNGQLINRIPGPPGYPIIGNIPQYVCSREKQWKFVTQLAQYYPIFKVWAIFRPFVLIRHPDDLRTILSGTNHIEKSMFYDFLRPALGDSIFISRGAKWHSQRKMLTPAFNFNLLQQFVKIFLEQGENMTKSLKNTESTIVEDLESFVGEFTLNVICETVMGTNSICLRDLRDAFQQYRKAVHRTMELFVYRLLRPWLHNDWLFSLTPSGREQKKILRIFHGFSEHIIAERKLYHERTNGRFLKSFANVTSAQADDTETNCVEKKQFALLDLLITASREGLLSDLDIRQEVDTFIAAGHDTTARALCFLLALLAEHKDIQDRVRKEVDTVIQENGGSFCIKSLKSLKYLERCIKESMRLYPSGPFISRVTCKDVKLQSYLIPAGTILLLDIHGVHRDPNFWPNPEIFEPDRFLPEKIRNQHSYSYIPFSAGPRNCIGQRYALLEMQALIAILIRNFYLEPMDTLKNLRLQLDMMLTPIEPLRARFVPIPNNK